MKKTAFLLAAAMVVTSLTGCGQQGDVKETKATKEETSATTEAAAATEEVAESTEKEGASEAAENQGETEDPAFAKFDEPVDIHIGMPINPADKSLPEGDTAEDNQYTRYLKENYNINVIVDWTAARGADYNQKVSLAIASDTLPDAVIANDPTYITKAAKSNMLYDMTDIWDQYASEQVKGIVESGNGLAMGPVTFDGRMYGLPGSSMRADGIATLAIRQDWLDECGLEGPKTLEDVENIAKVFKEKKPGGEGTIPILGPAKAAPLYSTFLNTANYAFNLTPVFNACDSYPGYWIENEDGTVTYGSTTEEMKEALTVLNRWYEEGLLDPELGTRDDSNEPLNAGKVGMTFGCWSLMGYTHYQTFLDDPDANWQSYPIYDDEGKWNASMRNPYASAIIVSKNVSEETARALQILYNVCCRDEQVFDTSVDFNWYPLRLIISAYDEVEHCYGELYKILDGTTKPEDYSDPNSIYKLLYADSLKVKDVIPGYESGRDIERSDISMDNIGDFKRYYSCLVCARPIGQNTTDKEVPSATYILTPTMEKKWSNLWKLESETTLKMILGQQSIDTFDQFVEDWRAQGGDEIIAEIEADLKNK